MCGYKNTELKFPKEEKPQTPKGASPCFTLPYFLVVEENIPPFSLKNLGAFLLVINAL